VTVFGLIIQQTYQPWLLVHIFRKNVRIKAHSVHSRKISTDRKFSENIIVNSWKFSTSKFFSDGKFVLTNYISQNFPEWKWDLKFTREISINISLRTGPTGLGYAQHLNHAELVTRLLVVILGKNMDWTCGLMDSWTQKSQTHLIIHE
jgi:hypothetical protein